MSKARTAANVRRKVKDTLIAFAREDKLAGKPGLYRKTKDTSQEVGGPRSRVG